MESDAALSVSALFSLAMKRRKAPGVSITALTSPGFLQLHPQHLLQFGIELVEMEFPIPLGGRRRERLRELRGGFHGVTAALRHTFGLRR